MIRLRHNTLWVSLSLFDPWLQSLVSLHIFWESGPFSPEFSCYCELNSLSMFSLELPLWTVHETLSDISSRLQVLEDDKKEEHNDCTLTPPWMLGPVWIGLGELMKFDPCLRNTRRTSWKWGRASFSSSSLPLAGGVNSFPSESLILEVFLWGIGEKRTSPLPPIFLLN